MKIDRVDLIDGTKKSLNKIEKKILGRKFEHKNIGHKKFNISKRKAEQRKNFFQ